MTQAIHTYLARPEVQAYLNRPRVKPILIFAGLGLLTSFVRTLVIDPAGGTTLPIFNVADVLLRLSIAALWFLGILVAIRPGKHTLAENLVWTVLSLGVAFLLTWADRPAAALMIIPVVARYWLSMRQAVALLLALLAVTVLMYVMIPPVPSFGDPEEWAGLVILVVVTVSQGAFTYAAFELLVQNEMKEQDLNAANRELRETQAVQLQSAALEERTFISRELHDTIGHELAALRLEVQRARKLETKTTTPSPLVLEALDGAMTRSGKALEQLQLVVSALRTPQLDGTLFDALGDLIQAWPNDTRLRLNTPEPPLTTHQKLAFYRGVQEALTNAYKHAVGQTAQIEVSQSQGQLHIVVCNSTGGNLQPAAVRQRSGGTGLAQLASRFQDLGGQVQVRNQEEGFTVWMSLPLQT